MAVSYTASVIQDLICNYTVFGEHCSFLVGAWTDFEKWRS